MEEDYSCRPKSDSSKKRPRKRAAYTRKAALSRTLINTAEARREIVNALQLHRRQSSSSNNRSYCRQLTESMPIPQPTWSTTAPAVLSAPVPAVDVLEVEWFDNVSSSYSWWLGFLKSLDTKKVHDAVNESTETSNVLGPCLDVHKSDDDPTPFTDEWVIFPADED